MRTDAKRISSLPTQPKIRVSFGVLSVMCIMLVRLQSDFISLYEFEEAIMPKLYIAILTVCSTAGFVQCDWSYEHDVKLLFSLFQIVRGHYGPGVWRQYEIR